MACPSLFAAALWRFQRLRPTPNARVRQQKEKQGPFVYPPKSKCQAAKRGARLTEGSGQPRPAEGFPSPAAPTRTTSAFRRHLTLRVKFSPSAS